MKRLHTVFLAGVLLATSAAAKPTSYNFAGIPWNSSKQMVKIAMAKSGYTYDRTDDDGDLWFGGKVSQENAKIVASFTPANRLVQIQVIAIPAQNFFIQRFKIIKSSLTKKYGAPDKNQYSFASPYRSGDGYETQAIQRGKATLASSWMTEWVTRGQNRYQHEGLTLGISDKLRIYITYSDAGWNTEYKRRFDKGNDDL